MLMRRPIDDDSKPGGLDISRESGGAGGGGGGGGGGKGGKRQKNSLMQVRHPHPKSSSPLGLLGCEMYVRTCSTAESLGG